MNLHGLIKNILLDDIGNTDIFILKLSLKFRRKQ